MRKTIYSLSLILVFAFSACTLYIPPDFDTGYRTYRFILQIEPEDAQVLLDGRFKGEAWEFASYDSALKLRSRQHELIIKKRGYVEEVIDLREFDSNKVTIHVVLKKARPYRRGTPPMRPRETQEGEIKPEYIPKTVKEKEADEMPMPEAPGNIKVIPITLKIEPPEASIYLNGKFWGISPTKGDIDNMRLKPGKYILEVVKPGYKNYKKTVILKDQDSLKLFIKLTR